MRPGKSGVRQGGGKNKKMCLLKLKDKKEEGKQKKRVL